MAATAFLVYVAFLLWAYIYRFDPYEAVRAASYQPSCSRSRPTLPRVRIR